MPGFNVEGAGHISHSSILCLYVHYQIALVININKINFLHFKINFESNRIFYFHIMMHLKKENDHTPLQKVTSSNLICLNYLTVCISIDVVTAHALV